VITVATEKIKLKDTTIKESRIGNEFGIGIGF